MKNLKCLMLNLNSLPWHQFSTFQVLLKRTRALEHTQTILINSAQSFSAYSNIYLDTTLYTVLQLKTLDTVLYAENPLQSVPGYYTVLCKVYTVHQFKPILGYYTVCTLYFNPNLYLDTALHAVHKLKPIARYYTVHQLKPVPGYYTVSCTPT